MSLVEYGATAEDHCSLLVLVVNLGGSTPPVGVNSLVGTSVVGGSTNHSFAGGVGQLKIKTFNRIYERISHVRTINITANAAAKGSRMVRLRYRRDYPVENNEWGDFQYHRRVLGLISVGRCEPESSGANGNSAGVDALCHAHEQVGLPSDIIL